ILLRLAESRQIRGQSAAGILRSVIEACDASIRIAPHRDMPWSLRGAALALIAPRSNDPEALYRESIDNLTKAHARNGTICETLVRRGEVRVNWGIALRQRGENPLDLYHAALEDYNLALELNPQDEEALNCRAAVRTNWALYRAGTPEAEELLRLAFS